MFVNFGEISYIYSRLLQTNAIWLKFKILLYFHNIVCSNTFCLSSSTFILELHGYKNFT